MRINSKNELIALRYDHGGAQEEMVRISFNEAGNVVMTHLGYYPQIQWIYYEHATIDKEFDIFYQYGVTGLATADHRPKIMQRRIKDHIIRNGSGNSDATNYVYAIDSQTGEFKFSSYMNQPLLNPHVNSNGDIVGMYWTSSNWAFARMKWPLE